MRPQYLHVLGGRAISCLRHLLYILQQRALRIGEICFLQLALSDCLNCFLIGSLNTQEVCM